MRGLRRKTRFLDHSMTKRMRELPRVFEGLGTIITAHIVRLSVLYEDLRIETLATAEKSIKVLDVTDASYRSHYFLRRSIATLVEFAQALRLLNKCDEFHVIRKHFVVARVVESWDEAVSFFREQESFLKLVRNDIRGHFGLQAAQYAVTNADQLTPLDMEITEKGNIHLNFAGEVAAAATMRHLDGGTPEEKITKLLKIALTAFGHATNSVYAVSVAYLWDRFDSPTSSPT